MILVSILILLEVILEEQKQTKGDTEDVSFNPYFTGSNSGSKSCINRVACIEIVSILILLEVILEVVYFCN